MKKININAARMFFMAGLLIMAGPERTKAQNAFIGEIRMFAGTFAPSGWMLCQGQMLSIAQNSTLFSILGTTYGGNGQNTFALPNLCGRVPIGMGQGTGLSPRTLGESYGEESHTLIITEMPAHIHTINADANVGSTEQPENKFIARNAAGIPQYGSNVNTTLAPQSVGIAGGSQPHNNMQPYLVVNYIICVAGVYPTQ